MISKRSIARKWEVNHLKICSKQLLTILFHYFIMVLNINAIMFIHHIQTKTPELQLWGFVR